jgi:hypothetical protein
VIDMTVAAARIAADIERHLLMKGNRSMTDELRDRIVALADALGPLANDAAQITEDLTEQTVLGTPAVRDVERKLTAAANSLRYVLSVNRRIDD